MSAQPAVVTKSKKLDAVVNNQVIREDEYEIVYQDKSNYWDQLRAMIISQGWTTQDHATLNILQEMPNSHTFFVVRKADNLVLGGLNIVETEHIVYGNAYVMRSGFRASGLGVKLIKKFLFELRVALATKPLVGRAVQAMWKPYVNRPFNVKFFYEMRSCKFSSVKDLTDFFPAPPAVHNYHVASVKDIMNYKPWMFQALIDYDRYVTGQDRSYFLKDYFSIDFVEGVALFDQNWDVKGLTAIAPAGNIDGLYKLNPIYASSVEDAGILVHAIAQRAKHPKAQFVTHVRTNSAGDWILNKCRATNRKLYLVGATICATNLPTLYRDISRPELIFAPTNSPAHFDG